MTKEEIVSLIENLESVYVTSTIGLAFIGNPDIRRIGQEWLGGPDVPVGYVRKKGDSGKEYTLSGIFNQFFEDEANNNLFINFPMMAIVAFIYDVVKKNGFFKTGVPEYEFLFHIRNAMSHGNRFNFTNKHKANKGEIKIRYPASFENFVVEEFMHGMPNVIPDYIEIADVLGLIEYIKSDIKQS